MPVQIDELNIDMVIEDDPSSSKIAQDTQHCDQSSASVDTESNQQTLSRDEIQDLVLELIEQILARDYT